MSAILGCKGVQEIDQYPFDLKESDLSELRSKKNFRPNSNYFGKIVEFDLEFGFYIF